MTPVRFINNRAIYGWLFFAVWCLFGTGYVWQVVSPLMAGQSLSVSDSIPLILFGILTAFLARYVLSVPRLMITVTPSHMLIHQDWLLRRGLRSVAKSDVRLEKIRVNTIEDLADEHVCLIKIKNAEELAFFATTNPGKAAIEHARMAQALAGR